VSNDDLLTSQQLPVFVWKAPWKWLRHCACCAVWSWCRQTHTGSGSNSV